MENQKKSNCFFRCLVVCFPPSRPLSRSLDFLPVNFTHLCLGVVCCFVLLGDFCSVLLLLLLRGVVVCLDILYNDDNSKRRIEKKKRVFVEKWMTEN